MVDFELPGITFYIGIDPGANGGIAILCDESLHALEKLKDKTEDDIVPILKLHARKFAMLEHVHAFPKMGVVPAFGLGNSFGFLRGLLSALNIPREYVYPRVWQKALGCLSKGDKNVTKAAAQRLFPAIASEITHATADALLIAEHCRRTVRQREGFNKEGFLNARAA